MPRFGEALATKALIVVYLERWLPLPAHERDGGAASDGIYWLCGRHEVLATVGGLDELAEELLVEPASWLAEVVADRIRARTGASLAGRSAVTSARWVP
jgi:hypothetical protein